MAKKLTPCNIFCGICVLCMLNGNMFSGGGSVARLSQLILLLFGVYYFYIANTRYKLPVYFKGLNLLLAMFTIYGVALIITSPVWVLHGTHTYLKLIYESLLPIYAFFVFAKEGQLTEKRIVIWYLIFFVLVIQSYHAFQSRVLAYAAEEGRDDAEFTNGLGYRFAALLPGLVLFRKKPVLQYLLLAVCAYYIISAMKRGAILCGAVCLLWFFIENWRSAKTRKQRGILVFVTILVIVAGTFFVKYMLSTSDYFQFRVEQTKAGDDSNRSRIYGTILNYVLEEENVIKLFFGNGAMYTYKVAGTPAHQDWLEIALGQGVLGVIIYFIYFVCFFISWRRTKRCRPALMAIGMSLIIYFLSSLYSMSYDSMPRFCTMVMGYYFALYNKPEQNEQLGTYVGVEEANTYNDNKSVILDS